MNGIIWAYEEAKNSKIEEVATSIRNNYKQKYNMGLIESL